VDLLKKHISLVRVIVLAATAGWIVLTALFFPVEGDTRSISAPRKGFTAPDFILNISGSESTRLSQYRGQVVLINFWATWCLPCRQEMPAIQAIFDEYRSEGLVVLAVDALNDSPTDVAAFAYENDLSFTILFDPDGRIVWQYAVQALPTTFFVDRKGVIRNVVIGGPMSEEFLRLQIMDLLDDEVD